MHLELVSGGLLFHPKETPVAWIPDAGIMPTFPKAGKALLSVSQSGPIAFWVSQAIGFKRKCFQGALHQAAGLYCMPKKYA